MAKTQQQLLDEIESKFGPKILELEPKVARYHVLVARRDELVRDVVLRFERLRELEILQASIPEEPTITVPQEKP